MRPFDPNLIPGMIEPVERELLYRLARDLPFSDEDCAVEFGSFFGKSTAFIAQGLAERAVRPPTLYAYDSFGCDSYGSFRPLVFQFAASGGVTELVREESGRVDFLPVFQFYLKPKIDSGAVVTRRAELINSFPPDGPIMLMHIDSPKMYVDFKPILFRFLPRMKIGGALVFQDFFYHWSASLIAAVGLLARVGVLEFRESAASSLVCTMQKSIDYRAASEIDLAISSDDQILDHIDYAYSMCLTIPIDRSEVFLPRLQLAKVQWLTERGDGKKAAEVVTRFFQEGGRLNNAVLSDFVELMANNFSMARLYRLDHRSP
jgi:hypothetical protein